VHYYPAVTNVPQPDAMIRNDTIKEFNVDSKAEYSA